MPSHETVSCDLSQFVAHFGGGWERRVRAAPDGTRFATSRSVRIALGWGELDLELGRVLDSNGESRARLSAREVALVRYLHERRGRDVSRDELLQRVFEYSPHSLSRALDAAVVRLRKKIEPKPASPRFLLTAHGHGYRWVGGGSVVRREIEPSVVLRFADREVDLGRLVVICDDGERIPLTSAEAAVLRSLARRDGWVLPEDLGSGRLSRPAASRRIKHVVYRLRRKLEADPSVPRVLVSARERGYQLARFAVAQRPAEAPRFVWSVVQHAASVLRLQDCVLYLRESRTLTQVAAHGPKSASDQTLVSPVELRVGEGIVGAAAATGCTQTVPDTREDRRYIFDVFEGRSELAIPILHQGQVIGVLDSESARPNAYDDAARATLASLAHVVAAGLADAGWITGSGLGGP